MGGVCNRAKAFDWYGRKGHVTVGGGKTICAPAYGPVFILEDGAFHRSEKRDFSNFTKLHASSKVLDVSNPNMMDFNFMLAEHASNWAVATTLMLDERPAIGSPEQCLIFTAVKSLGDYYGLPVRTGGSSCDAKQVDMQAGVESFSTMFATLYSGADLMVHSCGSLDTDNTLSYDKFIYNEEVMLSVQRILHGFEVTEETLLYDLHQGSRPRRRIPDPVRR